MLSFRLTENDNIVLLIKFITTFKPQGGLYGSWVLFNLLKHYDWTYIGIRLIRRHIDNVMKLFMFILVAIHVIEGMKKVNQHYNKYKR